MDKNDIQAQKQAGLLVDRHIIQNLCLTMNKALFSSFEDDPEILFDSKNYYPMNEDGEKDDDGEYPEIYEFWSITEWLAEKLEEKEEITFEYLDFIVWGRQATGQAILLDGVIQDIAKENDFR